MTIKDLNRCDGACVNCIRRYVAKHRLAKGESFDIPCSGIPQEYLPDNILASAGDDPEVAISMFDPVTWARRFLDWHCLDPDGSIWERKEQDHSLGNLPAYNEYQASIGKSIFHRPYQAEMLRCTSRRKIFRIGRQSGKTECLCIAMLHRMYTHENFNIIVIAPYQSQIDLIFSRLDILIRSNPMLYNSRDRYVKAPNYTMQLKNGSAVRGFTAGTRSGQDAGAARGQSAQMLVFDEADMLSSADIDASIAIITNFPDATVWMSSTPTGRREKFYKICHFKNYREFHYSSYVNPNWNAVLEADYRNALTEDGYKHEIEAEFGELEEGVYQTKYVEIAQADYEYASCKPEPNWTYAMGVDWNDARIGICLAVVGLNAREGTFYIVEQKVITRASYTQLTGIEAVINANRAWNPFSIYVDRGYGATQTEVLNMFGHSARGEHGSNQADGRLPTILKAYDFGSSIETYDPFTKEPMKKSAKPFLVENSVRRFEQCRMKYPRSDEKYTAALQGYIIKRVSTSGLPVYEQQNEAAGDHMLDAVNLALVAFTLEKTDLGKPKFDTGIAITGNLGLNEATEANRPFRPQSDFDDPEKHKPMRGRADFTKPIENLPSAGLPGANTGQGAQLGLWSFPGWSRDDPRPPSKTIHQMIQQAQRREAGGRPARPTRKKF